MSEEWLRGETVRLRALEPEDLELLYRWENNPAWWDVGNTLAPYSRYLLKQYIAESHRDIFELKQQRFMVDYLPEGVSELTEEFFVTVSGTFSAGNVEIVSLYAPQYRGCTEAQEVHVQ